MKELVSVLIPAFNAERWIRATLLSALEQTWPSIEVIVVDDGSKDKTLSIAREFESKGVRVFAQANGGASSARNYALLRSSGTWIQFLDADDLLDRTKIANQMALAERLGSQFAYCGKWSRFVHEIREADFPPQPLCRDAEPVDWLINKLRDNLMMHPAAWLIHRKLAERAGPWDTRLTLDDDGEYFSRVVLASSGVRHCEESVSYYRSDVAGSLSRRRSTSAWQSAVLSMQLTTSALVAREDKSPTRAAAANAYQRLAHAMYPDCPELVETCERAAASFGGSHVKPGGGVIFRLISSTFGWRCARRIQHFRTRRSHEDIRSSHQ